MIAFPHLPSTWELRRISELVTLNPKHDRLLPDHLVVSFIPMSGVDDVTGTIQTWEDRPLGEVRKGYTHFRNGDILFAKITPCMENGKCAVVRGLTSGLGCGSTEFFVLRPNDQILPEYLHFFLRQESYRQVARAAMTGAVGQARVPKQFLLDTEIPVPPMEEQRRIVCRTEEMMERSQRVRGVLRSALDEARLLRTMCLEGAYQEASRRAAALVTFSPVLEDIRGGTTQVPSDAVSPVKVLRSSAVRPGAIDWSDTRFLPHAEQVNPQHLVQDGDLLITRLSGSLEYVGNMAVVHGIEGQSVAYPDRLFRARLRPGHVGDFYSLLFGAPSVRKQLEPAAKSSAGHQRISISNVKKVTVPLCDEHIQRNIAESTLSQLQRIDAMLDTAGMAYHRLESLEQAILSTTFSCTSLC